MSCESAIPRDAISQAGVIVWRQANLHHEIMSIVLYEPAFVLDDQADRGHSIRLWKVVINELWEHVCEAVQDQILDYLLTIEDDKERAALLPDAFTPASPPTPVPQAQHAQHAQQGSMPDIIPDIRQAGGEAAVSKKKDGKLKRRQPGARLSSRQQAAAAAAALGCGS